MMSGEVDRLFAGSIPRLYEAYLVPLIFEPYAVDLAARVAARRPQRVLEIAAGTGVVTRHLARRLDPEVAIIATDLNRPMLDEAAAIGTCRAVEWREADAMQLPFADASFDVVVCQFGAMFFPDKAQAYAQVRRVLRSGGAFLFNVWDRIEHNEFADTVSQALQEIFPDDPPRFMARVPHGYHDTALIARDLRAGGFARTPDITTLAVQSRAGSAHAVALAYCQGTPWRGEIEARDASRLTPATDHAAAAIARRFGQGVVVGKIQAHVIGVKH